MEFAFGVTGEDYQLGAGNIADSWPKYIIYSGY